MKHVKGLLRVLSLIVVVLSQFHFCLSVQDQARSLWQTYKTECLHYVL